MERANLKKTETRLISPFGGSLIDLSVNLEEREALQHYAAKLPRVRLTPRNTCDLELLANGAFSPLDRYMGKDDYYSVIGEMRLANGVLFPIPVTLSVDATAEIKLDSEIALADEQNDLLAIMQVEEVYEWNLDREAQLVCGTTDPRHPLVAEMHSWRKLNISGPLRVLSLPLHEDFRALRLSPQQVRKKLPTLGAPNVVAFAPRNPLHRADQEMTKRAIQQTGGTLLLHPVVGVTKPGDIDHYTRVRSFKVLSDRYYDPARTLLALLPVAMRKAGPREAVWQAIIHRNFGANHVLVGPDYASTGGHSVSQSFYKPYEAQQLLDEYSREIAVKPIIFSEFLYVPEEDRYEEATRLRPGGNVRAISVTEVRDQLQSGRRLPEWIMQPDVVSILNQAYPPRDQQGFCIWFTGLSGSGKSTTARIVTARLMECGRRVTVLDGDVVRTQLSKGLGFGKEDRDTNIRRIGFVAAEIVRHGGAVICAAVSPYRSTRNECRAIVGDDRFIEIFVNTPLDTCALRDKKGMYALAREGKIKGFTGIDDPYEMPVNPEVEIETLSTSAEENAKRILQYIFERGFLLRDGSDSQ